MSGVGWHTWRALTTDIRCWVLGHDLDNVTLIVSAWVDRVECLRCRRSFTIVARPGLSHPIGTMIEWSPDVEEFYGSANLTEEQVAAWPNCSVPDCPNKANLWLGRGMCYPHSMEIPLGEWERLCEQYGIRPRDGCGNWPPELYHWLEASEQMCEQGIGPLDWKLRP